MADNYSLMDFLNATSMDISQEMVGRPYRAIIGGLSGYDIPEPTRTSYPYWKSAANTVMNIPKRISTSLAESMGGTPSPVIPPSPPSEGNLPAIDFSRSIMPGIVEKPLTETENFRKLARGFYIDNMKRYNTDMQVYKEQVNNINKEIKRISDKGRRLGKSPEEILKELKYQSGKRGWNNIKEPKIESNFEGISKLFEDKTGKDLSVERGKLRDELRQRHIDWTWEKINEEVNKTYPISEEGSPKLEEFNKGSWK